MGRPWEDYFREVLPARPRPRWLTRRARRRRNG
jgi:hypothetical protein